jgi:hypothetical protein
MNEQMKQAWLEISRMLGEPTREELDVFLRTWQRAMEAQKQAPAEQAVVPDAILSTDTSEHVEYIIGWNDCRAEMLRSNK